MSDAETRDVNDAFFAALADPAVSGEAAAAINEFTRAKIAEAEQQRETLVSFFAYETIGLAATRSWDALTDEQCVDLAMFDLQCTGRRQEPVADE